MVVTIDGATARTVHDAPVGAEGRTVLEGLDPGPLGVQVSVGSLRRSLRTDIVAGRVTEVSLRFAPGAVVDGYVSHVTKGRLAGIKVVLGSAAVLNTERWHDELRTSTDETGYYRLEGVPPGSWPIRLQGPAIGYDPRARDRVEVPGPGTYTHDIVLGGRALLGSVTESGSGRPMPHVLIQAFDTDYHYVRATTDAEGRFALHDVAPGSWSITASLNGYTQMDVVRLQVTEQAPPVLDIVMEPAGTILLEITDGLGRPVVGEFTLGIEPAGGGRGTTIHSTPTTDDQGRYAWRRTVPGAYVVTIQREGFETRSVPCDVGLGETRLVVQLRPTKEQPAPRPLTGRVADAIHGGPLEGARVVLTGETTRSATTGTDGTYLLRDVPPGRYTLVVSLDGFGRHVVQDVEVGGAPAELAELSLSPAVTLELHLVDPYGQPVSGEIMLNTQPLGGRPGTRAGLRLHADLNGVAISRQILPGSYELRLTHPRWGTTALQATLAAGGNAVTVEFE